MASQGFQPFQWHLTNHNYSLQPHSPGLFLTLIIFSIILLITFFFFFFYHFVNRYGHFSTNTADSSSSAQHATPAPAQLLGLDSAAIKNLPIFLHRSLAGANNSSVISKETECSICLGIFRDEETIKVLPKCHHAYHSECVDKWLSNRSSCPLCRAPLQVESPCEFAVLQL